MRRELEASGRASTAVWQVYVCVVAGGGWWSRDECSGHVGCGWVAPWVEWSLLG